jgi:two-component system cell cycle sensor histidine kinase/response regulator CckA
MKILVAEDERISRRILEATLRGWGHEVVATSDGAQAWAALQLEDAPQLAILDWMMPFMDGVDVCRRVRESAGMKSIYLILLTAKGEINELVAGMAAGANDYIAKPFHPEELRARVQAGIRMVELQQALTADLAVRKSTEEALLKSEEKLRQSQKLEAVGQLAGGIAHDFNNLLTAITGYSHLSLRNLDPADPMRPNLEEIKKAGERAAALTRQLLAFSRRQILQPKVLNLNSLITDLGKMLCRLIPEDIEFVTVLRPEAAPIYADPGQIEQVLMNLVVNARDAMPSGGKITIETANVDLDAAFAANYDSVKPGPNVMLSISDIGCGMSPETQEHIFEPFFTTREVGKGTGLGLSTVYGIVKQSGGSIWATSELGLGTTFKIFLPQYMTQSEPASAMSTPSELPSGSKTILLVEDERMVRTLVRNILEESGYYVLEATRGTEALRFCEDYKDPIHLMITDLVMPQMGGRELARAVEKLRPEIPVLYMSGYTDDVIMQNDLFDPSASFLEKPFTLEALSTKVRKILTSNKSVPVSTVPR